MSTLYCGGRLDAAAHFDILHRYAKWLLNVAACLAVMLTAVSCVSPRIAGEILHQRAEIKTLRLSVYPNDFDWRQMQTNGPNLGTAIAGGVIGVLDADLKARSARKDLAVEAQLESRYEANFFRCLSVALLSDIQSNTIFQVTDSRTAPSDADLILFVQNVTYGADSPKKGGRRSTWAKKTPTYIVSALIIKDTNSIVFLKRGNLAYATKSWLWNARVRPDTLHGNKREIVYSVKDARDEEEIARRIAQALAAELADDFRQGVFMKGQTPLEQSLRR